MLGVKIVALLTPLALLLGERSETVIITDGTNFVYSLNQDFDRQKFSPLMIMESDSLFIDGVLIEREKYIIDLNSGTVVLFLKLPRWRIVRVVYRYLLFPRPKEKRTGDVVKTITAETTDTLIKVVKVDAGVAEPSDEWNISGGKTLGVSVGTIGGIGIDQATHVVLSGKIEDITVDAALSDRNSPISPEGTTLELQELDKITIKLSGKQWQGSFGDVVLSGSAGSFGVLKRQAVGASLTAKWNLLSLTGGYVQPRGDYGRITIVGIDGVQGPYLLLPEGKTTGIVPGSEEIYLDGKRLVRGWDADYTIDYSTGELVFTNRHIISRNSRIEAQFQLITEIYQRSAFTAGFGLTPGGFRFDGMIFREGDNPEKNIFLDLTPEQKQMLGSLGKDTAGAWLPGGKFVGLGRGEYLLTNGYYQFVGEGKGDYRVEFTFKGESLGSYDYDDSLGAFRYVGANAGSYVDSIRVVLPKRNEFVYGRVGFTYSRINGDIAGIFGRRSLNLFAPDGANIDAGGLNFNIDWGDTAFSIEYRHQIREAGFVFPGTVPEADFSYRWAGTKESERKRSDEVIFQTSPWEWLELRGELGRLQRFDSRTLSRWGGKGRIFFFTIDGFKVSDFYRLGLTLTPQLAWCYPQLGWKTEEDDQGRTRILTTGMSIKPFATFSADAEVQLTGYENKDSIVATWQKEVVSKQLKLDCNWRLGEVFRLDGLGGYQSVDFYDSLEKGWNRFFGGVNTWWLPFPGVRLAGDINQSYRRVQLKDEQFRYVGPGKGNYIRDTVTGNYIYDSKGDYERVLVSLGRFTTARELTGNITAEVTRFKPATLSLILSENLNRADSGDLSEQGRLDIRIDFHSWEPALTPKIGFSGDRSYDRTMRITGKMIEHYQWFTEMSSNNTFCGVDILARMERLDMFRRRTSGLLEYEERGWRFSVEPIIGIKLRLETGIAYETKMIAEPLAYPELGKFRLDAVEVSVRRTHTLLQKAKVRTQAGFTYRWASVARLPWDVMLTRPPGFTPQALGEIEYLFNEIVSILGRYTYSDRPDQPAEHAISCEMRAYF